MIATRRCAHCKEEKPEKVFTEIKGKFAGRGYRNSWCNSCRSDQRRGARPSRKKSTVVNGQKLCLECNKFLSLHCFSRYRQGIGGVASYCRPCRVKRSKTVILQTPILQ